ncbi:hypothetical protein PISMIDRAFT_684236 [Pisolithus microcarpus 441]|uniref:Uncharacterized protein n=1 Tax=Pisolithus microcarpus 441 TaxID=765257 RepID=A0A0C9Y0V7_9AGAM|nr:hypothetical protein PISMIDRAFT_684236 [Pisolithus microcarpus 441]
MLLASSVDAKRAFSPLYVDHLQHQIGSESFIAQVVTGACYTPLLPRPGRAY